MLVIEERRKVMRDSTISLWSPIPSSARIHQLSDPGKDHRRQGHL